MSECQVATGRGHSIEFTNIVESTWLRDLGAGTHNSLEPGSPQGIGCTDGRNNSEIYITPTVGAPARGVHRSWQQQELAGRVTARRLSVLRAAGGSLGW
ncbi:unnamed protein product [Fusarium equiseti]|uniref:Uncharacterized protein n=1 Tax=Fusarium equiseti TaxID=61235 RepID=A0A8J2IUQ6_FUSEQ|nr:unnamed protein product [Fusarium equiseti]